MRNIKKRQKTITEWYRKYHRLMRRLAIDITDNTEVAKDIIQDSFKKIIEKYDKINQLDEVARVVYITAIVKSISADYYKKVNVDIRYMQNIKEDDILTEYEESSTKIFDEINFRVDLENNLMKLQEKDALLIVSRYLWNMSYREISQFLSIKEVNVPSYLARAMSRLKKVMEEEV